jgi:hypothetical protein
MKEDIMKKALWIVAAVGALLLAVAALRADESVEKAAEKAAEQAAKVWLGSLDAGEYAECWKQASSLFQSKVTEEQWKAAARNARGPYGKLLSRKVKSAKFERTLPYAPDGEYVVIQYETSFENKKDAIETVTPMKDKDGAWKVSGYYVR